MSQTALSKDVTEAQFKAEVIDASSIRPVVVDLWATWCAPCRQLSPLLDAAAARHAGEVDLVKIDVDRAPRVAQALGVQGIPAVKAFRDGRVVAEFTGAQPKAAVDQFFASLAPSAADRLAAAALNADGGERERLLEAALGEQPDHPQAVVATARMLADRGEVEHARALLARIPADPEGRRLLAELAVAQQARDSGDLEALRSRVAAGDPAGRVDLGRALAAAGSFEDALSTLMEAVRDPETRADARTAVLEVFDLLGDQDARVRTWRPRLAAALF